MNYLAILVAAVAQFIFGFIWYTPIFGKTWGKIHGFDQVPEAEQKEMMKGMWKILIPQMIFTVITTVVFAMLLDKLDGTWSLYCWAFIFWLGFVLPTQVAGVLFGGTKPEWIVTKIAIMGAASLICLEIIAVVFRLMM